MKAQHGDIPEIKHIADANKKYIGFIMTGALIDSINKNMLIVSKYNNKITGFINYHYRKDEQTTLYEICVDKKYREQGHGKMLWNYLLNESKLYNKKIIQAKCPVDGIAHSFYFKIGFTIKTTRTHTKNGKKLITWIYNCEQHET